MPKKSKLNEFMLVIENNLKYPAPDIQQVQIDSLTVFRDLYHEFYVTNMLYPIIIEHDWSSLVDNLKTKDMPLVHLPFNVNVFEAVIDDEHHLALLSDYASFVAKTVPGRGPGYHVTHYDTPGQLIWSHKKFERMILGASIMIDASVGELVKHTATKSPFKKHKKPYAPPSFYSINLGKPKKNYENKGPSKPTGIKQRAHFRKSHMRKLPGQDKKIRIPWYLAGDPDLGWVDKEFRI